MQKRSIALSKEDVTLLKVSEKWLDFYIANLLKYITHPSQICYDKIAWILRVAISKTTSYGCFLQNSVESLDKYKSKYTFTVNTSLKNCRNPGKILFRPIVYEKIQPPADRKWTIFWCCSYLLVYTDSIYTRQILSC